MRDLGICGAASLLIPILTLKVLIKTAADDIHNYFFNVFHRK